jgi:hypothetical protein
LFADDAPCALPQKYPRGMKPAHTDLNGVAAPQ